MTQITMPSLSDSMQEGTILSWLKSDGDVVRVGDELLEIETDKATMAYESPSEGVLTIVAAVGETLPVGAVIATLSERAPRGAPAPVQPGAAPASETSGLEPAAPARQPDVGSPAASGGNGADPAAVRATPLARRLARAHGIDLGTLRGTGPRGRITRSDVAAQADVPDPVTPQSTVGATDAARPPATLPGAEGDTQELTRTQRVIARRMAEAKATVPDFQVQTEARMDALIALRAGLKALGERAQPVPSVTDFIVKASALALRAHPRVNGSYRDGRFELHPAINIGIAVAAPDALVVPTITDADQRSLREIALQSREQAQRVRDGTVTPPELSGATFTVSNLGMYGMTAITPVINPPQAAILGVGAARTLPAIENEKLIEHQLITLTLSCDHRILYGADAARFLSDIRDALEAPLGLML